MSGIFEAMRDAARDCSSDELLALADAWVTVVADEALHEVERYTASERLRAVKAELARREALSRVKEGVASPAERRYAAWRELAATVRERADLLRVLEICGWRVVRRPGAREAHAACPLCGGTDRLVVTPGPPGKCWCRRCHWGGDVITVARSLRQLGFRDAVAWLADVCGERRVA